MNYRTQLISTAALIGLMAAPALAQDEGNPAAPASTAAPAAEQPGEILVTARRRSENIEKVPISITAIGGEQLRTRSIFSDTDLQTAVPGLTIRQNGSANQYTYTIRGQSIDTYTNSPPAVLPYIDEVQIVTHSANPLYDLEGIQVLKGPQGTLFGRNTTGGAILFQTAKPADKLGGYILGRYGNFNSRHVEGAISLPVSDKIAFRIAGNYTGGGAFVKNIPSGKHLGNQDIKSIRGTMVLKPIDGLTNTTVVQYTHEGGNNVPSEAYSAYACGDTFHGNALYCGAAGLYTPSGTDTTAFDHWLDAHPNVYNGGVVDFTKLQRELGPWKSFVNLPLFHRAHAVFVINTTNYELSPSLTLKNIVGYNHSWSDDGYDYDGTPYPIFQSGGVPTADATSVTNPKGFIQGTKQFSDELQLQGKAFDNRLVYVIGAYYSNQRNNNDSNLYAFDLSPISPGLAFAYHMHSRDESKAIFAQGSYKIAGQLNLTGGFRYTWDKLSADQASGSVFGPHPVEHTSASNPSWTVSLDYQATPTLLLYVTHRGSWRTGGYNYNVNPVNNTADDPVTPGNRFLPETTKDVEAGFKYSGRGLGVPVTFNADVYNQWVDNIQRALYVIGVGGSPNLFTDNVRAAEIRGLEADFTIRPAPWLSLGASGAYTHARYTKPDVLIQGVQTHYGPFADSPKLSGNVFFDVTHELGGDTGKLALHTELYAQSKLFFSNVAGTVAPGTTIKGYALVNARLSWGEMFGTRLTSAFYVRNLFNKKYYAGGNAVGPSLGINTSVPGTPRMFGGELRFDF